jgi:hypothetical protein
MNGGARMGEMPLVNIHFPITMPPNLGFEVKEGIEVSLFGRRVTLLGTSCMQVQDVPEVEAEGLISRISSALPWTWVQLGHGFLSNTHPQTVNLHSTSVAMPGQENSEVKRSSTARFAGQYPTIYPTGVVPDPIWAVITLSGNQPFDKFIASLEEGSRTPPLTANVAAALDLFSSIEYEISNSSKFVLLMTAFELVIDRVQQPPPCLRLVERLIADAEEESRQTTSTDDQEVLAALAKQADFLKRRSIRQSVRALALECARINDIPQPDQYARKAMMLYDKRSAWVHAGEDISNTDVHELHEILRLVLATKMVGRRVWQPVTAPAAPN